MKNFFFFFFYVVTCVLLFAPFVACAFFIVQGFGMLELAEKFR